MSGPTWQDVLVSVLLDVLLLLSYVGGVDLLRPVLGGEPAQPLGKPLRRIIHPVTVTVSPLSPSYQYDSSCHRTVSPLSPSQQYDSSCHPTVSPLSPS